MSISSLAVIGLGIWLAFVIACLLAGAVTGTKTLSGGVAGRSGRADLHGRTAHQARALAGSRARLSALPRAGQHVS